MTKAEVLKWMDTPEGKKNAEKIREGLRDRIPFTTLWVRYGHRPDDPTSYFRAREALITKGMYLPLRTRGGYRPPYQRPSTQTPIGLPHQPEMAQGAIGPFIRLSEAATILKRLQDVRADTPFQEEVKKDAIRTAKTRVIECVEKM